MTKQINRVISSILIITFITTQAFALWPSLALSQDLNSASTLGPGLVSGKLAGERAGAITEEAADRLGPGAIGNGPALINLVIHRILPPKVELSPDKLDELESRLRQAIQLATSLYEVGKDKIPKDKKNKYRDMARQAAERLRDMIHPGELRRQLYPFNSVRDGMKNYLVGFPLDLFDREEKAGLAVDFIDWLYNVRYKNDAKTALWRMAQYIFHECAPEHNFIHEDEETITRDEHRDNYNYIQIPVFGEDEVKALGEDLSAFIAEPHGGAAALPSYTVRRGIVAKRVAIVGDSQRVRLTLTRLVESNVPVVAWACHVPPVNRVPFLTASSTHSAFHINDVRIVGNRETGDIALRVGKQKEDMRQLVFDTDLGKDSKSAKTIVRVLSEMGIDTVILDKEGFLDEKELNDRGISVVVMDKEQKPQDPSIVVQSFKSEGAFRIGRALSRFAGTKNAEIQFGQMKIIEPSEITLPPSHRGSGGGELRVNQTQSCQREFREGLGIVAEEPGRVAKTLRFSYPVRHGLIMTATVVMNRQAQGFELKKLFEELAQKDGFFVVPEEDELLNTERIAGEPGLYLYGEPLVQVTEDGRSLIQVSFIADPIQSQVEEVVQILQGIDPRLPRVPQPVRKYQDIPLDAEQIPGERELKESLKADLAGGGVSKLIQRFGRRWHIEEVKKALRDNKMETGTALPILFDRQEKDFKKTKFLMDGRRNKVGVVAFCKDGVIFATTLLSPQEPEEVAKLLQNYYQALREFVSLVKPQDELVQVRDIYQPQERLSALWQVRGEKEFVLLKILRSNNGKDTPVSSINIEYRPFEPDRLGVFVNGAGGRIGSQVTRIMAGDAIDPRDGSVLPLSGKLIPVGIGVSGFEKDDRRVSGAEAFARLVKDGDSSTGPFIGDVRHGYENGGNEDWVELTPKGGRAIKIPVFSDRVFRDPENYPLSSFLFAGVSIAAVDATGVFTDLAGMNKYLWAGAERVDLTAPGSSKEDHWQTHTFVYGINSDEFHPAKKQTASASCTTTCASALNDIIERVCAKLTAGSVLPGHLLKEYRSAVAGVAVTYHSYTGETRSVDGSFDPDEKTQGRVVASGGAYLAPTGFAKAGKIVIPEVNATGDAIRGPWPTASVLAQVIDVPGHWDIDDIRRAVEEVKREHGNAFRLVPGIDGSHRMQRMFGALASMQAVVDESCIEIVHARDNWGRPRSVITIPAWYENEWGFSTGVTRFLDDVVRPARAKTPGINSSLDKFPERLSEIPEEENILYSDRNFMDQIADEDLGKALKGKVIFVRADYNVVAPVLKDTGGGKFEFEPEIIEDFRILKTVRDLQRLRKAGARIVLTSHNGRFKDVARNRKGYSLEPVAKRLSELLGTDVKFFPYGVEGDIGFHVRGSYGLKDGEVLLLENLRINPGEEDGSADYAEKLAKAVEPDAYVFLAFGAAHRGKHASIGPLMDALRRDKPGIPVIAGGIIHEELKGLKTFLNDKNARDSAVAVLGGAKVADKIEVMRKMIMGRRVKRIAVLGAMSVYFYMAKGIKIGNTFLEDDAEEVEKSVKSAFEILRLAEAEGVEIVLPADYRGLDHSIDKEKPPADLTKEGTHTVTMGEDGLPAGFYAYSVGEKTVNQIANMIKGASWVVLNGTAGMVEVGAFRHENDEILAVIDEEVKKEGGPRALLLGGDGVAAFSGWARQTYGSDYLEKISPNYTISTGGGASLELFSRLTLSGLEPLDIKVNKKDKAGMKPKIAVYGNLKWRIHTKKGIREHLKKVVEETRGIKGMEDVEVVLFVPSDIADDKEFFEIIKGTSIKLGVQNIKLPGEDTNELTADEANKLGYTNVLIGHSDRRGGSLIADRRPEDNQIVNARLRASLEGGLTPLFLFGETLNARLGEIKNPDERWSFIDRQLAEGLRDVTAEQALNIRFAVEPVWAIGKQAASSLYANVELEHVRSILTKLFGADTANRLVLGYGGGTNERNIVSYISRPEIDFVLPGRPSAEPRSFAEMIKQAVNFSKTNGLSPDKKSDGEVPVRSELSEALISEIRESTEKTIASPVSHITPEKCAQYVLIMKKDLPIAVTGEKATAINAVLVKEYQRMKQQLNKLFNHGKGVVEVGSTTELVEKANPLIAQGKKVIILDDGSLTSDVKGLAGRPQEDYCAITVDPTGDIGRMEIPFVNLNAMAMMGVGVLCGDEELALFKAAYKIFRGVDAPSDILNDIAKKARWLINVLPRILRLSDELGAAQLMKRLVDAAA